MRRGKARGMGLFTAFAIIALLGAMAVVRLAPLDAARWHADLAQVRPKGMPANPLPPGSDAVRAMPGGAYADLSVPPGDAADLLARLDGIARATPRTRLVAGSLAEGRITWETRSLIWGFPDYTTAQVTPAGLTLYARLRFGFSDLGVNAARLRGWLQALAG